MSEPARSLVYSFGDYVELEAYSNVRHEFRDGSILAKILVEVTSPSSEEYDRGEKREQYQQIASLAEYVVLSHRERYAEIWRRTPTGWTREEIKAGGRLRLAAIDAELELDRVYELAGQAD